MTGIEINKNIDVMFGFKSFKDFIRSVFGIWYKELVFFVSMVIGFAYYGTDTILQYIDGIWFSPPKTILLTITVIIVDWAVGVYGAIITKTFETKKAQRLIPMLLANWLMLSGLYNINKFMIAPLNMEILTGSMNFFVLFAAFYLAAVHFISAVVNAGRANLIDGKMVQFIMDYVDKRKNKINEILDNK